MVSTSINVLFLMSATTFASSYTIQRHFAHVQLPSFHQRSLYRHKRAITSQLKMTSSSSETQNDPPVVNTIPTTTAENNRPTRSKMRVSELKKALDELNVKYDDCFDQESLLVRYNEAVSQEQREPQEDGVTTTAAAPPPSSSSQSNNNNMEPHNKEAVIQSIRQMSVQELRKELGQRRVSRVGLFEKTDLVQAVYQARMMAQSFSVTGLLQPYMVTQVTGDQLQQEIRNGASVATTPLLVDVYATWCGPCQLMSKQLTDVAEELGDSIRIVKLDSDQYPDIASQLRIQGLPTIILYGSNGTEMKRVEGAMMKDQLIKWIQQQQQ